MRLRPSNTWLVGMTEDQIVPSWLLLLCAALVVLLLGEILVMNREDRVRLQSLPKTMLSSKPEAHKPHTTPHQMAHRPISRSYTRILDLSSPARRYAFTLVPVEPQMACLIVLWDHESGWSPTSDNPTSSAYGIPQILGLKAKTGNDYKAQVRAGLSYIKHRYGSPCSAWAFWQNRRWY
jgi:hypothetical protein